MKAKHSSNGHVAQLKAEQQLALARIQKRIFQYQAQAGAHTEEARKLVDQARAADLEFGQAVQAYAKQLGVDVTQTEFDFDKLQFKAKEEKKAESAAK